MVNKKNLLFFFTLVLLPFTLSSQETLPTSTAAPVELQNSVTPIYQPTINVTVPKQLEERLEHLEKYSIVAIILGAVGITLLLVIVGAQRRMVDRIHHEVERTQILLEDELENLRPSSKVRSLHSSLNKKYLGTRQNSY